MAGFARRSTRPLEGGARRRAAQPSHGDARDDQLAGGPQGGRDRRRVEPGQGPLRLVEATDQKQAPKLEMPRIGGVDPVALGFERRPRRLQRLDRPAEVARDEGDFGFGDNAAGPGHGLSRTKGARRPTQKRLGPREVAELRHGNPAQRQRRRVVAQRDALQRGEDVALREQPRRRGDQRVHRNPVTLVTLTARDPALSDRHRPTRSKGEWIAEKGTLS